MKHKTVGVWGRMEYHQLNKVDRNKEKQRRYKIIEVKR